MLQLVYHRAYVHATCILQFVDCVHSCLLAFDASVCCCSAISVRSSLGIRLHNVSESNMTRNAYQPSSLECRRCVRLCWLIASVGNA
jgi:hypothetical protein